MKKLLLSVAMLAVLAAPSLAYVQGSQLSDNNTTATRPLDGGARMQKWLADPPVSSPDPVTAPGPATEPVTQPFGEETTRPIPEPGTMILASLGLLALGASRARRRGR